MVSPHPPSPVVVTDARQINKAWIGNCGFATTWTARLNSTYVVERLQHRRESNVETLTRGLFIYEWIWMKPCTVVYFCIIIGYLCMYHIIYASKFIMTSPKTTAVILVSYFSLFFLFSLTSCFLIWINVWQFRHFVLKNMLGASFWQTSFWNFDILANNNSYKWTLNRFLFSTTTGADMDILFLPFAFHYLFWRARVQSVSPTCCCSSSSSSAVIRRASCPFHMCVKP